LANIRTAVGDLVFVPPYVFAGGDGPWTSDQSDHVFTVDFCPGAEKVSNVKIQYNTMQFEVKKCLWHCSHFAVSSENDDRNKRVLSSVSNVRKDFEDVTSGGRLFSVFAAATGNAT